ncbi:galactose-1-phosphate uridylyltransferase [Longivirga aurantiaca]|uniref:Galactose-1-phosphate uridylyltransferase n=1 Tax=Longivirga aurantiaca TaxID=1837743 RepID=A0ABW1SXL8_9ACTN
MRRTVVRLADGRELVHFDHDGAPERTQVDTRPLEPRGAAPQLRHDPLLDEWVSVAAHRMGRTFLPAADDCPLCPSRPGYPTEVPSDDYDVVVFENRFPSFVGPPGDVVADGPFEHHAAWGRCEVVCFTSEHEGSFAGLSVERARLVVEAWADRTAELTSTPGVEQVFVFENRGEAIGVTMRHPHGQIYAYPFVTPHTRAQLESVRRHREATGRNLYDDVVAAELADGRRVVLESEHWVAFVPFASRWPVEVHLYPRRRVPDLAALTDAERDDLAVAYLDLLRRGDAFFGIPLPYIAAWHQAPVRQQRDDGALHLELFSVQRSADKLKFLAGSESAMGAFVNDREPESIAARLREVAGS